MAVRDSKIRQRSASVDFIVFDKKVHGSSGNHYFTLFTPAYPQVGIFDAERIIGN